MTGDMKIRTDNILTVVGIEAENFVGFKLYVTTDLQKMGLQNDDSYLINLSTGQVFNYIGVFDTKGVEHYSKI